jgi:hypothetical protein
VLETPRSCRSASSAIASYELIVVPDRPTPGVDRVSPHRVTLDNLPAGGDE